MRKVSLKATVLSSSLLNVKIWTVFDLHVKSYKRMKEKFLWVYIGYWLSWNRATTRLIFTKRRLEWACLWSYYHIQHSKTTNWHQGIPSKQISINWRPLMIPFIREIGWQSEWVDKVLKCLFMFLWKIMLVMVATKCPLEQLLMSMWRDHHPSSPFKNANKCRSPNSQVKTVMFSYYSKLKCLCINNNLIHYMWGNGIIWQSTK